MKIGETVYKMNASLSIYVERGIHSASFGAEVDDVGSRVICVFRRMYKNYN